MKHTEDTEEQRDLIEECEESKELIKMEDKLHVKPGEKPLSRSKTRKKFLKKRRAKKYFNCTQCGKRFTYKQSLEIHMSVHTGEMQHVCHQCGKRFLYKQGLERHMRIHTEEKPFTCNQCGKSFTYKQSLEIHSSVHTGEKPHVCHQCGKNFVRSSQLTKHMRVHSREKPFTCDQCGKRFPYRESLKAHMRVHTGEKQFMCNCCEKRFSSKQYLEIHMRVHTGEKPFTCDQCGKSYSYRENLNVHMRIHTGERPFTCEQCGKSFTQSANLKDHRNVHTGEKPHACDQCGKTFLWAAALKTHQRVHIKEKPHSCSVCGKSFSVLQYLHTHQKTHTGVRDHVCFECGKAFISVSNLKLHQRIHTGEKPYKCSHCDKRFSQPSNLKTHEMIHSREKLHTCDQCGKSFAIKGQLERHMRTHTGEKPYKCSHCDKRFSVSENLKMHERIHTGEKPYKCSHCDKRFKQPSALNTHERIHTGEKPHTCVQCGMSFAIKIYLKQHMRTHTGEKPYKCSNCDKRFSVAGTLKTHERIHSREKLHTCDQCGTSFSFKSHLKIHMKIHTVEKPHQHSLRSVNTVRFRVIYGRKKKLIRTDGSDYTSLMKEVKKKFSIGDKNLILQDDTGVEVAEDVFTSVLEEKSHAILWRIVHQDSECPVLDSSCSSHPDALSVSSVTEESAGPSSKISCSDEAFEAKQFVNGILEEKAGGPAILAEYKEHGELTDSTRRRLVNIVVAFITDKEGRVPAKETKTRCALGIVTLFPALKDPYSKAGYEHFYDPKSSHGYISWRLKNVLRQSKHHNTKNARSSATSDVDGRGGSTANWNHLEKQLEGDQCKEAISFMNHCAEKDQIFEKMKLTFKHRQQLIHDDVKSNTVFSVFPRFLDTKGLVLQDFDLKFGTETASRLLEQWDSLKPKVIAEAKTLTSNLYLNSLLEAAQANGQNQENEWEGWDSDMSSLLLLAFLLPPSAGGRSKSTKISIRDSMDYIVQFHKSCRSLTEHVKKTEGLQPHLVAVGSAKNTIHDFYIVLDGQLLPCQAKSSLAAFDELFKAYFVFSVSYPQCLNAMFTFIQTTIYKIGCGTVRETPRVKNLRAKLLN